MIAADTEAVIVAVATVVATVVDTNTSHDKETGCFRDEAVFFC